MMIFGLIEMIVWTVELFVFLLIYSYCTADFAFLCAQSMLLLLICCGVNNTRPKEQLNSMFFIVFILRSCSSMEDFSMSDELMQNFLLEQGIKLFFFFNCWKLEKKKICQKIGRKSQMSTKSLTRLWTTFSQIYLSVIESLKCPATAFPYLERKRNESRCLKRDIIPAALKHPARITANSPVVYELMTSDMMASRITRIGFFCQRS